MAFTARRMVGTTPAIDLVTRTRVVLATWTIWLISLWVRSWVMLVLATIEVTASLRLVHFSLTQLVHLSLVRFVLGMVQFVHLSLIRLVHLTLTHMVRFVRLSLVRLVLSLAQLVNLSNLSLAAAISSAGG